jgi:hypothetical protein
MEYGIDDKGGTQVKHFQQDLKKDSRGLEDHLLTHT